MVSGSKVREWEECESVKGRSRFFIFLYGRHWFWIGAIRVLGFGSRVWRLEGSNSVIKCF